MARNEHDREDLLAEATALVERIEFQVPGLAGPVVIGFRRDGCASVYFDQDPVYQFNTRNQLRRVYRGGLRYKAERGSIFALPVRRDAGHVTLQTEQLTVAETDDLVAEMHDLLGRLRTALNREFSVVGQVPADADIVGRCRDWLATLGENIVIAEAPNAR